jgi:hypothetical protein
MNEQPESYNTEQIEQVSQSYLSSLLVPTLGMLASIVSYLTNTTHDS